MEERKRTKIKAVFYFYQKILKLKCQDHKPNKAITISEVLSRCDKLFLKFYMAVLN